jgi:hypothetical protein
MIGKVFTKPYVLQLRDATTELSGQVFSMRSVRCEFGSWKPVSSSRELQLRGQRGQEPLDMEADDGTPLEAATKQRSEYRD